MSNSLLIGRQHPASTLRSAIARTSTSHGGLVLVTGEAGIGKTTLVTSLVAEASRDQQLPLTVLTGSSWESEAVPGYWPWMQILRSLRAHITDEIWQTLSGAQSPALAKLLGETLDNQYQQLATSEEFALHDAVVRLLSAASREKPLVIVLDDLHFADPASVRLLQFATQHTWFERILFIGTYRDMEVEATEHRLRSLLLPLVAKSTLITLTGLDRNEVAELIEFNAGSRPTDTQLAEITRRTGGNPFFVEQTAQLWMTGASALATTPGMSNSLQRRLDQVPKEVVRTLTWAAVQGHEFDPEVLTQSLDLEPAEVERHLHEAVRQRLLTIADARYHFVHDLVRETLQSRLNPEELKQSHAAFFTTLSAVESTDIDYAARLARHAWLAEDTVDARDAVEALQRAAMDASSRMSIDESHLMLRRAVERCAPDMAEKRVILRVNIASSLLHNWNDKEQAWRILQECVDAALELNDSLLMARVVLDMPRDQDRMDLLTTYKRKAYQGLTGSEPNPDLTDQELTRQLTIRAAIVARRTGDDEALGDTLWTLHSVLMGLGKARQRIPIIDEAVDIGTRTNDRELILFSNSLRWVTLLELNDPGYQTQLERFVDMALATRQYRWVMSAHLDKAMVLTLQGRFADAKASIEKARQHPVDLRSLGYMMVEYFNWQVDITRTSRGQVEIPSAIGEFTIGRENMELLSTLSELESGHVSRAQQRFSAINTELLHTSVWPLYARLCAQLGVELADPQLQDYAYEQLEPHIGTWLVSLFGSEISGPVSYWLGIVDRAKGNPETALAHFSESQEQADSMGFAPWSVRSEAGRAMVLRDQGDPAANRAIDDALARAREIDMPGVIQQLEDLKGTAAPPASDVNVFRFDKPTWTLRFDGQEIHLPDAKGLHDLQLLLSQPGQDLAATQMFDPSAGEEVKANARLGGDDILDEEAKVRYRTHLRRLDEQIDTAMSLGQDDVASDLDEERTALIDQLRQATGLGGRSRRLGDNSERARKTVTNRIRNTLKRIEKQHPALAHHLRESVSTGVKCVYQPGAVPKWEL